MSNNEGYWKSLNEMLRNDAVEFSQPKSEFNDTSVLTFKNVDNLKKGIQYALDNPKVVAKFEYDYNNGQPATITEKHLNRARVFIQSDVKPEVVGLSTVLNACSYVSIGDFLLECFYLTEKKQPEYYIVVDDKRLELISKIFGNEFTEKASTSSLSESKYDANEISCTQIIFESCDFESAIDELVMNLSDRTWAPWRIQSVYVQESLKNKMFDTLTKERLNSSNSITDNACEDEKCKNQELAKQYGGKLVSNDNNTIQLMFDVPPKYLLQSTNKSFHQIPVAINFFRTTKDIIQLMKTDYDSNKRLLTSVWTENIGQFYEVAGELKNEIFWSNSIGLMDKCMPLLNSNLAAKDSSISLNSTINTKGKYALHILCNTPKYPKYLYIPYGKTFAN